MRDLDYLRLYATEAESFAVRCEDHAIENARVMISEIDKEMRSIEQRIEAWKAYIKGPHYWNLGDKSNIGKRLVPAEHVINSAVKELENLEEKKQRLFYTRHDFQNTVYQAELFKLDLYKIWEDRADKELEEAETRTENKA